MLTRVAGDLQGRLNTNNLSRLGLTLEDAFEPCRNLDARQKVLLTSYQGDTALQKALSEYNTESPMRGMSNGYVLKIYLQLRRARSAKMHEI